MCAPSPLLLCSSSNWLGTSLVHRPIVLFCHASPSTTGNAVPAEDAARTAEHQHLLVLHTRPGTREVEQAVLSPPDVDIADIVEVAQGEECSMESVVCGGPRGVDGRASQLVLELLPS